MRLKIGMKKESEFIGISSDRQNHIIQVVRKMYSLAKKLGWSEEKAKEMFLLGLVHDCGYEFSTIQSEHAHIGGEILKKLGFRYWREVYEHGNPNADYESEELKILNIADFTVSLNRQVITPKDRVIDIGKRYGTDSIQYTDSEKLGKDLGLL